MQAYSFPGFMHCLGPHIWGKKKKKRDEERNRDRERKKDKETEEEGGLEQGISESQLYY